MSETALATVEKERLEEDGFLVVRSALPAGALQRVRAALADVVARTADSWLSEGLIEDLHEDAPFERRWALIREQLPALRPVTWRRVLVCAAMYDLWQLPELTGRVRSLLGDELWAHDTWNGRPREPGSALQRIDWHQDAHYLRAWEPSDGHVYTCWIPLVPVSAISGSLQVIPRSHWHGVLPRRLDEFRLKNVPAELVEAEKAVTVEAMPGDFVIFNESTVHRALDNRSDIVRWTVDIRFGRDSEAMRSKAKGWYLCRTSGSRLRMDDFETWRSKYDRDGGALAGQLRAIDAAADRLGAMGRDIRTF